MIYTVPDNAQGKRLMLVDQHDLDRLRGGHAIATSDGAVLIHFVRDAAFVNDKIQDALAIAPVTIEGLIGIVEEDRKRGLSNARSAGKSDKPGGSPAVAAERAGGGGDGSKR